MRGTERQIGRGRGKGSRGISHGYSTWAAASQPASEPRPRGSVRSRAEVAEVAPGEEQGMEKRGEKRR